MQINRLLEIVYVLLDQKTVTAKKLSEQFDVSQRTIYRDIDILSLAGIPIYTEKGKGGGISLLPEFVLNKSILSEQEQHEILSALQAVSSVKSSETGQVFKKLSGLFNKSTTDWLQVDFSGWTRSNSEHFNNIKTAILERWIIEFDYYNSYEPLRVSSREKLIKMPPCDGWRLSEKNRRRIEPVQLWFKAKAWYVVGFCLKRQDTRVFKLTRMRNLKITNTTFSARNLPSMFDDNSDEQQNPNVTLKLKIAPEMTHRILDEFDDNMIKLQPDGSFIVTVTWPESYWIYGFILSFGKYIEVLEPRHIRKNIEKELIIIQKKYL
jgi:predicted DNA-binding transcriptional regulator YafY